MTLSAKALAELLDELVAGDETSLAESESQATISGLSLEDARRVFAGARGLNWNTQAFDNQSQPWGEDELDENYAPFRVVVDKPTSPDGIARVLTDTAFAQWLDDRPAAAGWYVARLASPISTWSAVFSPWDVAITPAAALPAKSPRSLVREYGARRCAPADIRPWLLRDALAIERDDSAYRVWADRSTVALSLSSTNEIDSEDSSLKYKGPPRLSLSALAVTTRAYAQLGAKGFRDLQDLMAWVFEIERETEMRHLLAAAEIAQSGGSETDAIKCLASFARSALEGARVAYQLSLAEISKDSLKLLSDLRKAVAEEIGKLTDQTRQLVAAVTGALAVGVGLIAAKLTTTAPPLLLIVVMFVVAGHITLTIWSGWRFLRLQSDLRRDWRPRLYRFLPPDDYQRMVTEPVGKAESAFRKGAVFSGIITAILFATVIGASVWTNSTVPEAARDKGNAAVKPGTVETQPDHAPGPGDGQPAGPPSTAAKPKVDPSAQGAPGPEPDAKASHTRNAPVLKDDATKPGSGK